MSYGVRKEFYQSKVWKQVRKNIWLKQNCLCAICGLPVYVDGISPYTDKENRRIGIVHHKEYLTEININDDSIALDEANLVGVCKNCHEKEHKLDVSVRKDYTFDKDGNLMKKENLRGVHPPK